MSILELLGESYDPGTVGSLTSAQDEWRPVRSKSARVVRAVIALALIGGVFAVVFMASPFPWPMIAATAGIMLVYLLIAYYVRPKPDHDNLGWLGGAIDNPFRYSDDINRFLLFLQLVLLPGRFVTESLVELVRPRPTVID